MRFIISAILIILISFSLSVIPININFDNLDIPYLNQNEQQTEPQEEVEEEIEPYYEFESSVKDEHTFDKIVEFKVITNMEEEKDSLLNNASLYVYEENEELNNFDIESIAKLSNETKDENNFVMTYKIDLSQLDLKSGYYEFEMAFESKFDNVKFSHTVTKDKQFIGSANEAGNGLLYTRVYYVDEYYQRLIPVSRKIEQTETVIRSTINLLLDPPEENMGLSTTQNAPRIPEVFVSEGIATVHLDSRDLEPYRQGSSASIFAVDSIINTLGQFQIVDEVKFMVDGRSEGTFLHDMDLSTYFDVNRNPKAYLGLETTKDYLYLAPITIYEENLTQRMETIFSILQTNKYEHIGGEKALFETIPKRVKLLNYKFQERNIELDLSKEFLTAYQNEEYNKLMYESILYSFTSIEGIDTVSITIEGERIDNFFGYNISEPTEPNKYINTLN